MLFHTLYLFFYTSPFATVVRFEICHSGDSFVLAVT